MLPLTEMLAIGKEVSAIIKLAGEHCITIAAEGGSPTAEAVAAKIRPRIAAWKPLQNGHPLLDDKTRDHAAAFLGGLAVNIWTAKTR